MQDSPKRRSRKRMLPPFEPTAQESEKAGDKLEAYKRDELEKQEEERIRKESDVKGSDFYFDLHNRGGGV